MEKSMITFLLSRTTSLSWFRANTCSFLLSLSVSHTLLYQRLRCRLNILSATATLTTLSTGFFVSCVWFFCFSKFIHCLSSPNSSSVIFFCKWFQAVDNIFPKPLIYNLIFNKHPIIRLRKNHRFPLLRYEHSYYCSLTVVQAS